MIELENQNKFNELINIMKKFILIVDDDKRLRELLKDYLTEKNFEVYLCQDFQEAKEILNFVLFDLIILDRMMPSGDGIDLVDYSKNISDTPVILLTAMGEDKNRIDGLKTGADDYLSKPFDPESCTRIKKLINLYDNFKDKSLQITFGHYVFNTHKWNFTKIISLFI